ncbi:anoctamin-8-like [Dendronephthya gigantea]|uniref:anoctamin-8-like n=1 Tax=Dendronephthya gigantea TaxID=151771 RepID=UPI00106B9B8F|nr:anoctamin-8-like [Dendronephthya gigantea]XP_028413838.1 anoctamin-8-like [Dendronephthya gigantea]
MEYCITFTEHCSTKLSAKLIDCFKAAGLQCESVYEGKNAVYIGANFECLVNKAIELGIRKPKKGKDIVIMQEMSSEFIHDFEGIEDQETFFTPAEKSLLVYSCIIGLTTRAISLARHKVELCGIEESLVVALQHSKPLIIEAVQALHNKEKKDSLWQNMKKNWFECPVDDIRDYFGEEIAFYFAWMSYFRWALCIPSVFGIFVYFWRNPGITVDDNFLLPLYALFIVIWAVFFIVIWRRREAELSYIWNTYGYEDAYDIRPEFNGVIRESPVTGKPEKYFPRWRRWLRYLVSVIFTLPMLFVAVLAMLCSLNLNGYIKDKHSPIYVSALAYYAEPGHIFAGDSPYYGYLIPTVAHSIVINILNTIYRSIATRCTDFENHRTESEWGRSLIVKRVAFEAFDCFLPLFYIAFYQLDVVNLRRELLGLFGGDEIRRLVTETIIPFITENVSQWRIKRQFCEIHKMSKVQEQAISDSVLEEYDQFDDYLEMVMQFGYVTLFASAFPLASAVGVVFLLIESRSDMFKLLFIYQRPKVLRTCDIGVWYNVLWCMVAVSMLTNTVIMGFSSEQLAEWLPWMYETIEGDQFIKLGYGRYIVAWVFAFEHFLILSALFITWFVNSKPKWVRVAIAKEKYEKKMEAQEAILLTTERSRSLRNSKKTQ